VFVEAGELSVGDVVVARGSMMAMGTGGKNLSARPPRIMVNLKHHRYGGCKEVAGYFYNRVHKARLVIEAHMNGVDYDEFVHALKHDADTSATFKFLDPIMEVHHLDENTLNDDLDNLVVLHKREHAREHGKEENFNKEYTKEVSVLEVVDDAMAMTYDKYLTTVSMLFAVFAAWLALHQASQTRQNPIRICIAGTIMGAGISGMHYMGMAAMRMAAEIHYNPIMVLVSVVIAVTASIVALTIDKVIKIKLNAPELLRKELPRVPVDLVSTGDYQPTEKIANKSRYHLLDCLRYLATDFGPERSSENRVARVIYH